MARKQVVNDIITERRPPKPSRKVGGLLYSLFWDIALKVAGQQPKVIIDLISEYFESPISKVPKDRHSQLSAKNNLLGEITNGAMTLKAFVKALRVLKVKKLRLISEITHSDGETSTHEVTAPLMAELTHNNNKVTLHEVREASGEDAELIPTIDLTQEDTE